MNIKVFLLKNVDKVGKAGDIIRVPQGYASNFLLPRKLCIEITKGNEAELTKRAQTVEKNKTVVEQHLLDLAQQLKEVNLVVRRKTHDNGKLYGSISSNELADLLAECGVSVRKAQIELERNIKEAGEHLVTIKLAPKLQPQVKVTVVAVP